MSNPVFASAMAALTPDTFASANLPPRPLWPQMPLDLPHLRYPEQLNCIEELLGATAQARFGQRPALRGADGICWSYAQLAACVDSIAQVLRLNYGVRPGARVLLRAFNQPWLAAALLAVMKIGAIAVPSMPLLRSRELLVMLGKAQVNLVICENSLLEEMELALARHTQTLPVIVLGAHAQWPVLAELVQQLDPACPPVPTRADDICLMSFTSGTTGEPKATLHFHRDILAICDCYARSHLQLRQDDVLLGTPSLAFTFGLGGLLLFALRYGACAVLQSYAGPTDVLQAIAQQEATVCFSSPTFYRQMALVLQQRPELRPTSLRWGVSAGEALPGATRAMWQQSSGVLLQDGLGSTEMLHIFIASADGKPRSGAIGQAVPGYRISILDHSGKSVAPGVVGLLAVQGPTGCRYLADRRQMEYVQHGWNLTGDLCEMDEDGFVYYHGRADDMIISSGYNISAAEIEDVLLQHDAVAECAVIGVPDQERGQVVKAHLVLRSGVQPSSTLAAEIQDFVKQQLAPFKYPRQLVFLPSLPRTESGKLQRFKLRQS